MTRLLDVGLEQLTVMVCKSGEVAKNAINMSIRGFMRGKDATEAVRELSDILGTMTVEIENKAFELIVKYQPVASDLRIINSYMKIAYDFERYGRYAWDISSISKRLGVLENCEEWIPQFIEDMGEKVLQMVRT